MHELTNNNNVTTAYMPASRKTRRLLYYDNLNTSTVYATVCMFLLKRTVISVFSHYIIFYQRSVTHLLLTDAIGKVISNSSHTDYAFKNYFLPFALISIGLFQFYYSAALNAGQSSQQKAVSLSVCQTRAL